MSDSSTLAILGGPRTVPANTLKPWPPVDETDERFVLSSLQQAVHTYGPNCQAFEQEFAEWNGNRYAVTTNSGTAALHMAVAACGVGAGDEVIVTAYTWSSSATCILHHNGIPVFVDIDYDTMNMDVTKIEAAITERTRAIIAVQLHGLALDMDPIMDIARRHGLKVIEDCCQAHGATYKGKNVGTIGDCAAFSMNQNKNLCSGEGGMFVTDDEELLELARMVWSFGETRTPTESRDYHAYALGWMYRNNDLTAAFGRAQLTRLDDYLAWQRRNAGVFTEQLAGTPGLILPTVPEGHVHNWYNYILRFDMDALGHAHDAGAFRDKLVRALQAEGVENGVWQHFILPEMTVFQAQNAYGKGCPWHCRGVEPKPYLVEDYPVAQRHCAEHTCVLTPLRCPNPPEVVELTAAGVRKVMANLDQVEAAPDA